MEEDDEEWKDIPGYEGHYQASTLGRIRSMDHWRNNRLYYGKVLKPSSSPKGYLYVTLSRGIGDRRRFSVHGLVATTYKGPRPPGQGMRHLDGNSTNNRPSNLAWGTAAENNRDIIAHGHHWQLNKTHCKRGHALDETNTRVYHGKGRNPQRKCRACDSFYRNKTK